MKNIGCSLIYKDHFITEYCNPVTRNKHVIFKRWKKWAKIEGFRINRSFQGPQAYAVRYSRIISTSSASDAGNLPSLRFITSQASCERRSACFGSRSAAAEITRLRWEGHAVCETRAERCRAKLGDFVDPILLYLSRREPLVLRQGVTPMRPESS
jgi:hypothetical protein